MKKPVFSLLTLWVLTVVCFAKPKIVSPHAAQEDAIREVVFRYQIQLLVLPSQRSHKVYFLAFAEKNPPLTFMKHFKGQALRVRRLSEAQHRNGAIQDSSGKDGLILSIWSIDEGMRNKASVVAHHSYGDNQEDTYTYDLVRKNGRWKVTGYWGDFS